MAETLLTVRGLGVGFRTDAGLRPAVGGMDFDLNPGQILALVGESGSGKSVTALSLLGLLPPTAEVTGSARLGDTELIGAPAAVWREVRGARLAAVFQEPFSAFNPVVRIGRQIVEAIQVHRTVSRDEARDQVHSLLGRVGLSEPERVFRSFPHQLSGGQLQRAMIALAISCQPDVLIADEPTTALDVTVQAGILALLRELRDDLGMAVLLITHDMGVVAELADDVIVLQDGTVQEAGPLRDVMLRPQAEYTRNLLAAVPRLEVTEVATTAEAAEGDVGAEGDVAPAPPAAAVEGVSVVYGSARHRFEAVKAVTLSVPAGRTVGLVGESGSGKTTLGLAIARLLPTAGGEIQVGGRDLSRLRSRELRAARADIGFVFQDPVASLNPRRRVGASIAQPLRVHAKLPAAEEAARVAELLTAVQLNPGFAARYPHELSGGERQRVAIARALALKPTLVIADEPTSALDVSVQARILDLLLRLQDEYGFGCLFISHNLAVVNRIAQFVVVMKAGEVVEQGPTAAILSDPEQPYTRELLAAQPRLLH